MFIELEEQVEQKIGLAISFCNIEERAYLKDIQKLIDQKIPVVTKHPFADEVEEMPTKKANKRTKETLISL